MYNKKEHKDKNHWWINFLQCFSSKKIFGKLSWSFPQFFLEINGKNITEMPGKGSNIKFTGHCKQLKAPFVKYADFEYILKK